MIWLYFWIVAIVSGLIFFRLGYVIGHFNASDDWPKKERR